MSGRTVINDRYELEELPLARGGMGEVWLGRDTKLERKVAVKFIRFPDGERDDELVRRFVRESRITARLEHPGVPAVYDVGTHDGQPYIVMQYVDGISVADLIAEHGPLPVGWAAAIAAQACAVLAVAHRAPLVHRDLKPANLMLEADGGVKILDFGLAVALDRGEASQITRTGQALGTAPYMAPEQILGSFSGPATDLYGLGCTLHEMLSGRRLFTGPTAYAVMSKQVNERPRPVRALRPDVPVELERLILELLEKNAEDRPGSAEEVYQRLLPFATGLGPLPGVLTPPTTPSPLRMYARVLERVYADGRAPVGSASAGPGSVGGAQPARPGPVPPAHRAAGVPRPRQEGFSRGDLDRARKEANRLVRESRYSQAAEVLSAVVEPASQVLGSRDDEVLSLRRHLAEILYEGGDYRRGAQAYQQLAADLAERYGEDAEDVLHCRQQEANCLAITGQTSKALRRFDALVRDARRVFGEDDPRTLELRRQFGLLQMAAGQRHAARRTLRELMADLRRLRGPDHPDVRGIGDLLDGLADPPLSDRRPSVIHTRQTN